MAKSKSVENNEMDLPQMKQNGFQEAFDKLTTSGEYVKVTEEIIPTNEFGYYMNSNIKDHIIEFYNDVVDVVIDEFVKENPKVKKISKQQSQSIRSLAVYSILETLDEAIDDENHNWYDAAYLLLNNYFFTPERVSCAIAASVNKFGKEIPLTIFKPKMEWNKAYDKMLKWYVKPEATEYQVPQKLKYKLSKVKQHIDTYMWEEFLKQEYYTAKLVGLEDDSIIDLLDNPTTIMQFCDWCKGYGEGVNKNEIELNK